MPPSQNPNPYPYPSQGPSQGPPLSQFPAPAPQEPEKNPYDFFLDPAKPPRKNLLPSSPLQKIGIIAGIIIVLGMAGIVLMSVLFGNKNQPAPLVAVVQSQEEVIRVATDGSRNSHAIKLQNFATTTIVTVGSAQHDTITYLGKHHIKVSPKELAVAHSTQTDQALAAALAANTYDTTFMTTMKSDLDDYETKLKAANATSTSQPLDSMLKKQFEGAELLRKQLLQP